jgi:ketosteroid isomerase-like protein
MKIKTISVCLGLYMLFAMLTMSGCATSHLVASDSSMSRSQLHDLMADYGYTADQRDTGKIVTYFTADGVLSVPSVNAEVKGHQGISALFGQAWKQVSESGQQRRHIVSSLRILEETAYTAKFRAIMNVTGTPKSGQPAVYITGVYFGDAVLTEQGWLLKKLEINID